MTYHPMTEKLVEIMMTRAKNPNPAFFRISLAFYYGLVASQMRASLTGYQQNETLPINIYAINLSPSGTGKNLSSNLIEDHVLSLFNLNYPETFSTLARTNVEKLSLVRSKRTGETQDEAFEELSRQFMSLGTPLFTFDSATVPAIKQLRQKFLMANCGALNLLVDEIGANLLKQNDALGSYLELYDRGYTKFGLTKNTSDNTRVEHLTGSTPANMLLFGTPTKVFDGAATEKSFFELLEMGYARRCLFGFSDVSVSVSDLTPEEILRQMRDRSSTALLEAVAEDFGKLSKLKNAHRQIDLPDSTMLMNITYSTENARKAQAVEKSNPLLATELSHRHFKALKLSGAYAFIEGSPVVTEEHMAYAIQLTEDSGEAFSKLIQVDRPYVKLAKYLANQETDLSLADLDSSLPYFRGSKQQKDELINMAIAYGYKNNIVITKSTQGGVLFIKGESLQETSLDKLIISASTEITEGYVNSTIKWDEIDDLASTSDIHWLNHHVRDGYRLDDKIIPGFNLLVLDVDNGTTIDQVRNVLGNLTYFIYTTKRHTEEEHRFRIVLPMNYILKLDKTDYKAFVSNIFEVLPFPLDEQTNQRSRKWLANDGEFYKNEGELFDVLPYIPQTKKNEELAKKLKEYGDVSSLEKWFLQNAETGNRNNLLLRYAMFLLDEGYETPAIQNKVNDLNALFTDPLSEHEISSTIMKTVARTINE